MIKFISKNMITGLVAVLPVVLTFYLLYWMAVSAETILGNLIRLALPKEYYWPGMGLATGLLAVFLLGMLMHVYVIRRLFLKGEQLFYHMPLIKSVYRSMRDFFNYFSPSQKKGFAKVVAVTLGEMQLIGFVTQDNYQRMPENFRREGSVLVYLPLSYMIGGYAVLVPRTAVRPVDMSVEEAMRFTLTAGVAGSRKEAGDSKKKAEGGKT
ncbi:MAG: DUF502 domain-containing protein [Gammaproteobacteria bacterium]|nr:DUF502 domain-containing protein [Gammaproteobacteria bacterium]MDH5799920.1 DUF502 domain-containing protein [Gammaproteobacteria bacterium]